MHVRKCAALLIAVLGCAHADHDDVPNGTVLSHGFVPQPGDSAATDSALSLAVSHQCAPLLPIRIVLDGTLRAEVHLGPPGYGETPKLDQRDTITVLELNSGVAVCPDLGLAPKSGPVRVTAIQLAGVSVAVLRSLAQHVTVFGGLTRAVLPRDYLPVVLWVDSIPALERMPLRRSD